MYISDIIKKDAIAHRCYEFGVTIIALCRGLPRISVVWIITDQLIRSSVSVGANLIEGKGSSSTTEYRRFFEIALRSCNESIYWIHLLRDADILSENKIKSILDEAEQVSRILGKSVKTLRSKESKG